MTVALGRGSLSQSSGPCFEMCLRLVLCAVLLSVALGQELNWYLPNATRSAPGMGGCGARGVVAPALASGGNASPVLQPGEDHY
jgi:hypothetical protein